MSKKFFKTVLIAMLGACLFVASACGGKGDLAADGHRHVKSDWIVGKKPTCTTEGVKYNECAVCQIMLESETIEKLTHDYQNSVCTICKKNEFTQGLKYSLNSDNKGYTVVGIGSATDLDLSIKSVHGVLPVTAIATQAFAYSSITSVIIPSSVTDIGDKAFFYCLMLESVKISDGVKSIGQFAFHYCDSLKSVKIPDSVTSLGSYAFQWCSELTSVTIGNGVTYVGVGAFDNCSKLKSVTIPGNAKGVGNNAFSACSALTSVKMLEGVNSIGNYAFFNCGGLKSVEIPSTVTFIDYKAFYQCSRLTRINFNGTVSEWNKISKGDSWDENTGKYTVYCSDGEIKKA